MVDGAVTVYDSEMLGIGNELEDSTRAKREGE